MRSTTLLKPVWAAALGCLVLSGCGAPQDALDRTSAGSAAGAAPHGAPSADSEGERRFLALMTRTAQGCAPGSPKGTDGGAPRPEDLPGAEAVPTPRYGPGRTPPGVANTDGDIPVALDDPAAPSEPAAAPAGSGPADEVPLTGVEECVGAEHVKRVGGALGAAKPADHAALRQQLTQLDYPAARIHPMPDRAGAPRVRVDLRTMGGHVALEVTAGGGGVVAEAFGSPEGEDVKVTDVTRRTRPETPAS